MRGSSPACWRDATRWRGYGWGGYAIGMRALHYWGAPPVADSWVHRGKLALDPQRHECTWDAKPVRLTVTEFLILQALAQRPGFVKSRDSLMDAAYDDQVYVDDRTIDSHIKRLRKKFKVVEDSFEMIETLYGVGYRFKEA